MTAKTSTLRLYRTKSGDLVGENDPRAAFLAYAVGSQVTSDMVAEYDAAVAALKEAKDPAVDEVARAQLREKLHPDTLAPADQAPAVGLRLATELADEQRYIANADPEVKADAAKVADPDAMVTTRRLSWNEDRTELVLDTDANARFLAYAAGDRIAAKDRAAYLALDHQEDTDVDDTAEPAEADADKEPETPAPAPTPAPATSGKSSPRPADKAMAGSADK